MIVRRPNPFLTDAGLLMIRGVLGVVFLYHGSQKLFGVFGGDGIEGFSSQLEQLGIPVPVLAAVVSACTEFFGGLLVLLGLWLRLAVVPMVVNMIVAIVTVHRDAFSVQNNGMEYPLTLAVVLAALGLTGPGRFAVMVLPGIRKKQAVE